MAVTTTYDLVTGEVLDLTQGPGVRQAEAVSLADGGFAVASRAAGNLIDIDLFNAARQDAGGADTTDGGRPSITQLTNGNLVVASQTTGGGSTITYSIHSPNGALISTVDIADANSTRADVSALAGGGFAIVSQDFVGADLDIDLRIYGPNGGIPTVVSVAASVDDERNAQVTGLNDGGMAVVWQRDVAGQTEIHYAVYNADGSVRSAPALFDTAGPTNSNPDIVALANGGFAMVYQDDGWANGGTDITLVKFSAAGVWDGDYHNVSNPASGASQNDANPTVTKLANGLLVVGYENNGAADTDSFVRIFDPVTNSISGLAHVTAGEGVTDDIQGITLAGSTLGRINVFHENITDSDMDGQSLTGRRTSIGDAAANNIIGDAFIDIMNGAAGDDTLEGGLNDDVMDGGADSDTGVTGYSLADDFEVTGNAANFTFKGAMGTDQYLNMETLNFNGVLMSVTDYLRDDNLVGTKNADTLDGHGGNDTLVGKKGADTLNGGSGNDLLLGGKGDDVLNGGSGADQLFGGKGADMLNGGSGDDVLDGGKGNDTLLGGKGNDSMAGGKGADILNGGEGVDTMNGGKGADTFVYTSILDSGVAAGTRDQVQLMEANGKDHFDFSAIDAISGGADDAFTFIGAGAFTAAGQIRATEAGGVVTIELNIDAALGADMAIDVTLKKGVIDATDFVL